MKVRAIADQIMKEALVSGKDIVYAGRGKSKKAKRKIAVIVSCTINEKLYKDTKTNQISDAKGYEIDYDRTALQKQIDDAMVLMVKAEMKEKDLVAAGSWASIGFVDNVYNFK